MKWLFSSRNADIDASETVLLARLEKAFDADPDAFVEASKRPTAKDFELIGTFIQVYCFAELSARQIIEMIDSAILGRRPEAASRLAGHDVFPKLAEAAGKLSSDGKGNLRETLIRAAGTVEMHRQIRHTLAHWAVRRIEGGRAFLVLSKNAQEGKKRHGKMIGAGELHYGMMGTATLRRELKKLEQHTQNLSVAAVHMGKDRQGLASMLAARD